jgi:putative spermidine/putrescine transport system substrate-binding protein
MSHKLYRFRMLVILAVALMMVVTACQPAAPAANQGETDPLVKAAKEEGMLTVIALPHDWCNYGEAIETFKAKYGF